MKVLQVINSLSIGGAEKLVANSLPLLQKNQLSIDLLTLSNKRTDLYKVLKKKFEGNIVGLTSSSIYNPLLIFKIIPYLRKYDLVQVHLFPALYWVVLAKTFSFSKIKVVYTEHSTYNRRRSNFFFKILDKLIYNRVDVVVAISDLVKENLLNHVESKMFEVETINNGIDIEAIFKSKPYSKSDFFEINDFLLIQVSSFRYPKDQNTLIRSLKYLPENVKLLLVGQGNLMKESISLVKHLQLTSRVVFLGNRNDVPRLLHTADIVVLSSVYEGLSLSSIEAMAAAKPFIATDAPGLTEVVSGYGVLFEIGNEKELAQKIQLLYYNKEEYLKVAKKCYCRSKDFDIQIMIKKYLNLYNRVVNDKT